MIRPEQIQLAADGVPAEVVDHVYYGPETVVRLVLADDSRTPIVAKTFAQEPPVAGAHVHVVVSGPVAAYPQ
jgi:iron(III) transport system ATP-binding protein